MKRVFKQLRAVSVVIVLGALGGALSFWLLQGDDARKLDDLKENALCVLDLPAGTSSASASFTIASPVERFHVWVETNEEGGEALSISIAGDRGVVGSASRGTTGPIGFLGREAFPPGNYMVALRQDVKGKGGSAIISGKEPVYTSGWQIWSRTYVVLLILSGICVLLTWKAKDSKKRGLSFAAFRSLLLGAVLIFIYLLFHEGGHALAQISFGTFDLARSDFWGIHGHPHSGGTMASIEPWQRTLISCAGPMLPTLAGFALFLLWSLPKGWKFRSLRPMGNLYFSAIVAMLVFPEAVLGPFYLLGIVDAEGNLIGYVRDAGGPVWLVKVLLGGMFLFSAMILWRVLPEVFRVWKAQFMERYGSNN